MKQIRIFLKIEGNEKSKFEFPVTPASFEITRPYNNTSVNINSLGEVNLIGKRGLDTFSLSGFFPRNTDLSYVTAKEVAAGPYEYVKAIKDFGGQVCRLVISGGHYNHTVTIESFTYGENDATGDVNFTIEFKEYRSKKRVSPDKGKQGYVTKNDDTLVKIAKSQLGSVAYVRALYSHNANKIQKSIKKRLRHYYKKGKVQGDKMKKRSLYTRPLAAGYRLKVKKWDI